MVEHSAVNRQVGGSSPLSGATHAEVAELADAQDLKSCDPKRSYRFDSGLRHQGSFKYFYQMTRGGAAGSSSGS